MLRDPRVGVDQLPDSRGLGLGALGAVVGVRARGADDGSRVGEMRGVGSYGVVEIGGLRMGW